MTKAAKTTTTIYQTRDDHGNIVRVTEFGFLTPDPVTPPPPPATPEEREIAKVEAMLMQSLLGEYKVPRETNVGQRLDQALRECLSTMTPNPKPAKVHEALRAIYTREGWGLIRSPQRHSPPPEQAAEFCTSILEVHLFRTSKL